jgi:hypothetical protein
MPAQKMKRFKCTWCGASASSYTRPYPGNCSRKPKTKDGKYKPHTWVKV